MGKYEPLSTYLQDEDSDIWTATFAELEEVLGFSLPKSARVHREWWGNQRGGGHSQAKGWQDAGWQVWKVDLTSEIVEFRRQQPLRSTNAKPSGEQSDDVLFARASAYLGISDREQLVREAMKALCEREAARRLARLGGTMPDLQMPHRRRFD